MTRPPLHAQPPTHPDPGGAKRAAELCRARPDVFAAVVRRADELRRAGVEHDQALEEYDSSRG